jgi:DNA repair photolyase
MPPACPRVAPRTPIVAGDRALTVGATIWSHGRPIGGCQHRTHVRYWVAMRRTLGDLQRPDRTDRGQLPLALQTARRVTTPEFAGVTFLEVEAKSALNAVRGMPFAWSINPYRGCTHACSYCLAGDTPILMADGGAVALRDVRVGDRIWGTRREGRYRRFVQTAVRDHWSVIRPAHRVTFSDGGALVASAEHRLLTERGWRHVAQAPPGEPRRPRLTVGDWLAGPRGIVRAGRPLELATRVVRAEPLDVELELFDMTTGTGDFVAGGVVSHNCFARPTHTYLNLSPGADFERTLVVKTNVVDVLRAELARPGWQGEPVALGTNTDPYQRCEGRYRLLPGIIEALATAATPVSILTKGTLITRDIAVLAAAAEEVDVTAALTVGMLDEDCWRRSEPGTPHPRARLDAVRRLNDAGVPTGVMLAPIMPGINDDAPQLDALIDAAAAAGATHITAVVLHLRSGVRELFMPWLREAHPHLVPRYEALYRSGSASAPYREEVHAFVRGRRAAAWRRHGRPSVRGARDAGAAARGSSGPGGARAGPDPARAARAHAAQQLKLL